jgi:protein-S-isoprenylcysteine O-methyltransferase Ste14
MKRPFRKRLPYPVSGISWLLVSLQFFSLLYLAISAPLLAAHLTGLFIELGGIFLTLSGLIKLNWKSFSVFPEPRPDGQLETSGIYAFIRHPMYAGVFCIAVVLVFEFPSFLRILCLFILAIVFFLKIKKEERQLCARYPNEFDAWKKTSDRIIPFVW